MKWLLGCFIAAFFVTSAQAEECHTPAMIDGAMNVIHSEWEERRTYDSEYGAEILGVWNNGTQRPVVDADTAVAYIRGDGALFFAFKDNCVTWIAGGEPIFMPVYFLEALETGAKRRMGGGT
jgi:hypothetical protein